ncbi:hypothetical protein FBLNLFFT_0005 [Klebsiella phage Amrap]|uniref:Uncharacterized protein n=1 Tax=Klebsiella phage Amrap TaxID=3018530 RepID=A0AAF0ID35_9CAUD|nr:hypothetical protein FBLNLFFT_0005 [Klebsiella phage Amrap]
MATTYDITQRIIKTHRDALLKVALTGNIEATRERFTYHMSHLAQTYRTRKVMYGNPVRN